MPNQLLPTATRRGLRRVGLVTAVLALVLVAVAGPASAQDPFDVEVETTNAERSVLTVTFTGLDEFVGGEVVVYVCGNADADFNPIEPTERDCIGPSGTGYRTAAIEDSTVTLRYTLRTAFIGANDARCIPAFADQPACTLVVAAVSEDGTEITGVPLDDVLADLDEAAALPEGPETPEELPVTGLSNTASAVLLFVAAGVIYLGYLLWSATRTADGEALTTIATDHRR